MLYFNTAAGAIQYPCSQLLLFILGLNLLPCKACFRLACHTFIKQKVADTSTHSQELKIITSDACCLVLDQSWGCYHKFKQHWKRWLHFYETWDNGLPTLQILHPFKVYIWCALPSQQGTQKRKKKEINAYLDLANLSQNVRNPPESSFRWKQNRSQPAEHMQEPHG